jgi:hypothetical protein
LGHISVYAGIILESVLSKEVVKMDNGLQLVRRDSPTTNGSAEGSRTSDTKTGIEFPAQLSEYQILKRCTPWNYLNRQN